jgi:hypothetical protein
MLSSQIASVSMPSRKVRRRESSKVQTIFAGLFSVPVVVCIVVGGRALLFI